MQRRQFVAGAVQAAPAVLLGGVWSSAQPVASGARRIALVLSRFNFSASEVRVLAGETIVLVLTSTDLMHGFALPELNARIDVPPGRTVELTLRPARPGRFVYLCDNFCGEGHDGMHGLLIVADAGQPS